MKYQVKKKKNKTEKKTKAFFRREQSGPAGGVAIRTSRFMIFCWRRGRPEAVWWTGGRRFNIKRFLLGSLGCLPVWLAWLPGCACMQNKGVILFFLSFSLVWFEIPFFSLIWGIMFGVIFLSVWLQCFMCNYLFLNRELRCMCLFFSYRIIY